MTDALNRTFKVSVYVVLEDPDDDPDREDAFIAEVEKEARAIMARGDTEVDIEELL